MRCFIGIASVLFLAVSVLGEDVKCPKLCFGCHSNKEMPNEEIVTCSIDHLVTSEWLTGTPSTTSETKDLEYSCFSFNASELNKKNNPTMIIKGCAIKGSSSGLCDELKTKLHKEMIDAKCSDDLSDVKPNSNANPDAQGNEANIPKTDENVVPKAGKNEDPKDNANVNPKDNANMNPKDNANVNPKDNANVNPKANANEDPKTGEKVTPNADNKVKSNSSSMNTGTFLALITTFYLSIKLF